VTLLSLDWKLFVVKNPMVGGILLTLVILSVNGLLLTCLWVGVCVKWKCDSMKGQVATSRPALPAKDKKRLGPAVGSNPVIKPLKKDESKTAARDVKQGCSGTGGGPKRQDTKPKLTLVVETEVVKGAACGGKAQKKGKGFFSFFVYTWFLILIYEFYD
jgi:hypothetical protein